MEKNNEQHQLRWEVVGHLLCDGGMPLALVYVLIWPNISREMVVAAIKSLALWVLIISLTYAVVMYFICRIEAHKTVNDFLRSNNIDLSDRPSR